MLKLSGAKNSSKQVPVTQFFGFQAIVNLDTSLGYLNPKVRTIEEDVGFFRIPVRATAAMPSSKRRAERQRNWS
ncbi:MAG: hypothetical protein AAGU11_06110 [Syntrophobacteraceae bacterium]